MFELLGLCPKPRCYGLLSHWAFPHGLHWRMKALGGHGFLIQYLLTEWVP